MASVKISLVIPVYNEAPHLAKFMERILALAWPWPCEYVVVDDCSRDGSWEILQGFKDRPGVLLHRQSVNQGKGAALHKGFAAATGSVVVVQDADFEYDPDDLPRLIAPVVEGRADVVFGSRFHRTSPQVHRTFHYLVNRFLTMVSNVMSGLYLTDMETCYKVFRAEIVKGLAFDAKRFGFEPEVTAKIAQLKVRVLEFPISYYPRTYVEGKKITWKDGVAAVWFIVRCNLRRLTRAEIAAMPPEIVPQGRQWL